MSLESGTMVGRALWQASSPQTLLHVFSLHGELVDDVALRVADRGDITFNPAWLDTPGGWVVSLVLGVVVLTTLLHAARGVVSFHARTAKTLLVAQGA